MSWWKQGIPVPETRNSTKAGLHGGYVSSVEITLELTEKMNGEVYTCQARNAALERAIHDATTLTIFCKFVFHLDQTLICRSDFEKVELTDQLSPFFSLFLY